MPSLVNFLSCISEKHHKRYGAQTSQDTNSILSDQTWFIELVILTVVAYSTALQFSYRFEMENISTNLFVFIFRIQFTRLVLISFFLFCFTSYSWFLSSFLNKMFFFFAYFLDLHLLLKCWWSSSLVTL